MDRANPISMSGMEKERAGDEYVSRFVVVEWGMECCEYANAAYKYSGVLSNYALNLGLAKSSENYIYE